MLFLTNPVDCCWNTACGKTDRQVSVIQWCYLK